MSRVECLFQSFQGFGSIYISDIPSLTSDHLKKYTSKAIVIISREKKVKCQSFKINNLQQISVRTDKSQEDLSPLFLKVSNFMTEAKKHTNIIVWSPQSWELGVVFLFAHLILKYGHTLEYIWRLYDRKIKTASLSPIYLEQLKTLTQTKPTEEEQVKDQLYQTVLGKRILRIRKEYTELAKDSHNISQSKKLQIPYNNPQKTIKTKRQSANKDLIQHLQISPFAMKRRSSANNQIKTHRDYTKPFDV